MKSSSSTWAVTFVIVVALAAIVGLEALSDQDIEPMLLVLFAFLTPQIAALLKQDSANQKLDGIQHSLNGELDPRVRSIVREELSELRKMIEDMKQEICQ